MSKNSNKKEVISLDKELKEIENINKKFKTDIHLFGEEEYGKIEYIDSGIPDLNEILSGDRENGGWPRGRMVEIAGPEGSGKTYLLSRLYAKCQENGLKCMHIDAEGTYHLEFAKMHGVDPNKLHITEDDRCEEVMRQLEEFFKNNVYDVIGIDSLASLVATRTYDSEMGKQNFSPLAGAIANCYPRVNSALKKSKTLLVFINQLRDNVESSGKPWLDPEKTPGGRTIKFYASVRLMVKPRKPLKADRPDMFIDARRIGHTLLCKTMKNKIFTPFKECSTDLMYSLPSKAISIIEEAIDKDVIERQRNKKGELYGKGLSYKGLLFVPENKYDLYSTFTWLKENEIFLDLLEQMGVDDFEEFIESGDITEEDVQKFLISKEVKSSE
jgi:recombination protein RecA